MTHVMILSIIPILFWAPALASPSRYANDCASFLWQRGDECQIIYMAPSRSPDSNVSISITAHCLAATCHYLIRFSLMEVGPTLHFDSRQISEVFR